MMRLAKKIAEIYPVSRRVAETLIEKGHVSVNGQLVLTPVFFVQDSDVLSVRGYRPLSHLNPLLFSYYKPVGCLVTMSDPFGRPTIFDRMCEGLERERLFYVGRLDQDSEGLLLLTNVAFLAHHLQQPGWERFYEVTVAGKVSLEQKKALEGIMNVEGWVYPACRVHKVYCAGSYSVIRLSLEEGKKREIRQRCKALNLKVMRLLRTQYGPFSLNHLKPGEWRQEPWQHLLLS